ncbi:MAG: hypothetical protein WAM94_14035 [Chromatiaceae bacterium]
MLIEAFPAQHFLTQIDKPSLPPLRGDHSPGTTIPSRWRTVNLIAQPDLGFEYDQRISW